MFDIGSGELIVVAAVAIIVLGPETCMKYAQKAGVTLRKVQTDWALAKRHFGTVDFNSPMNPKSSMSPQKGTISSLKDDGKKDLPSAERNGENDVPKIPT